VQLCHSCTMAFTGGHCSKSLHMADTCRSKPPQAFYRTVKMPEGFHTTVYLPSSSGINQPVNTAACCNTAKASKNAAALEALRQLWRAGRLDPWMQPKPQ
jgi:hypothetical protein